MKSISMAAIAMGLALPTLAACDGGNDAPAATATADGATTANANANATEGAIPGLAISDPRMVLNAVEGNPAAIYFDLRYDGDRALALTGAGVEGAGSATIHEYGERNGQRTMVEAGRLPLTRGETLTFEPGGLHVMVIDPSAALKPGGRTELTLTVSGGREQKVTVPIRAANAER